MRGTGSVRRALRAGAFVLGTAALLALAPTAGASIGEGDAFPSLDAKEFLNCQPFTLEQVRGRLIFCEVFSTG